MWGGRSATDTLWRRHHLGPGDLVQRLSPAIGKTDSTAAFSETAANSCRGSGGTQKSSSSGGLYDTSSSSARFSSTSTLPSTSSTENYADDSVHAHPKPLPALPKPPIPAAQPGFVRAAGRTYSFGGKPAQPAQAVRVGQDVQAPKEMLSTPQANVSYADIPDIPHVTRPRAMTDTSGSTATPPKLLDTELDFGHREDPDDFGNMFEGFESERNTFSRSLENVDVPESVGVSLGNPVKSADVMLAEPTRENKLRAGSESVLDQPIPLHAFAATR